MATLCSISDVQLLELLSSAVRAERAQSAEVITQLAEVERWRLYLEQACPSVYAYCTQRLGYSEDAALKRARVVRLALRFPEVLAELASGAIHLTGLFVLSRHMTEENAQSLLAEARGKSRRQIDELIARRFPRPDVPVRVEPVRSASSALLTRPETGNSVPPPRPTPNRATLGDELSARAHHQRRAPRQDRAAHEPAQPRAPER